MKIPQNKSKIALFFLSILAIILFLYSYSTASIKYYPTDQWHVSAPEAQGILSARLLEMMEDIKKKGYNIQSISIVRNGYLVLDAYINPFQDGQKHEMHSVTKSVMSALIGIAIDQGYIEDVNQTITELFPDRIISHLDERKKLITLKDLLTMTSGLECKDATANNWAGTMAMKKSDDWTQYTLNLPMAQTPGECFHYCNGVSHLLSAIIQKSTGMRTIDFAKKNLFDPLGIKDVEWEESPEGISNGYKGLQLLPKDMAKIGVLYLSKGKWENRQIISAEWIESSTQPYIDGKWAGEDYGYQWWVNPAGFYSAVGMYGQAIYVVPDKNLVAVFTGNIVDHNMYVSGTLLKEYIIPAIASSEPLPPNPEEKARLDNFLAGIAKPPAKGIIWLTENEGVARDGIFKRTASPSFQFEYPLGCIKAPTQASDQVMRMKTPNGGYITASVNDIPKDWRRFFFSMKLEDFGPKGYASWIKKFGSSIEVISNNEITLNCGSRAYRTDIKWLYNNRVQIITKLISAYKDGKCVYVAVQEFQNPEKVEPLIQSLIFK